jgi:hypothetical protein
LANAARAYRRAYARADGSSEVGAHFEAKVAYKIAMPQLDTVEAVRENIACVAQGINM